MARTLNWLEWALRLFAGGVYLVSGTLKLADPSRFFLDVLSFNAVPYGMAYGVAMALPWLEVLGALALLTGWGKRGAVALLLPLTLGFIGLLVWAESQGHALDCGCFGQWLVFPNLAAHLAFNGVLALALTVLGGRWVRTK